MVICALGRLENASCRTFTRFATWELSPPSHIDPSGISTRWKARENSSSGSIAPFSMDLSQPAFVQIAQFIGPLHFHSNPVFLFFPFLLYPDLHGIARGDLIYDSHYSLLSEKPLTQCDTWPISVLDSMLIGFGCLGLVQGPLTTSLTFKFSYIGRLTNLGMSVSHTVTFPSVHGLSLMTLVEFPAAVLFMIACPQLRYIQCASNVSLWFTH
jgi:hypothetical protein